jgi:hypothetical protein
MFGGLGMLLWVGGAGFAGLTLYHKLVLDVYVHRNPFVLISVFLMLVGMQFVMMGVLAEILIRIYHEAQKRPVYSIRETMNI